MKKKPSKTTKTPARREKSAPAAVAKKPVAKAPIAPAPKKVAAVVTTITAKIDIGFGNSLYLRGEGPGLSWDKGVVMACVSDNEWQAVVADSAQPISFKFLVNDLTWNVGEDYVAQSGATIVLEPTF
jgi:hypothetical protein